MANKLQRRGIVMVLIAFSLTSYIYAVDGLETERSIKGGGTSQKTESVDYKLKGESYGYKNKAERVGQKSKAEPVGYKHKAEPVGYKSKAQLIGHKNKANSMSYKKKVGLADFSRKVSTFGYNNKPGSVGYGCRSGSADNGKFKNGGSKQDLLMSGRTFFGGPSRLRLQSDAPNFLLRGHGSRTGAQNRGQGGLIGGSTNNYRGAETSIVQQGFRAGNGRSSTRSGGSSAGKCLCCLGGVCKNN